MNFRLMRPHGFIPHSRLIKGLGVHQIQAKPEWWLAKMGRFPHVYQVKGPLVEVYQATRSLERWIAESNVDWLPWTCLTIDRRKSPRSMWAFSDEESAVAAMLQLRGLARVEILQLR